MQHGFLPRAELASTMRTPPTHQALDHPSHTNYMSLNRMPQTEQPPLPRKIVFAPTTQYTAPPIQLIAAPAPKCDVAALLSLIKVQEATIKSHDETFKIIAEMQERLNLEQQFEIQQQLDLDEQNSQCVEMEIQERLELEDQKKIATSTTIQRWHHRIALRRLELEQQFKFQQRLELEEQTRLAINNIHVELEIKARLKLEEQKKLSASIIIQKWHRSYMFRRLEVKQEQFEHPKEALCLTTSGLQHNYFLMADSKSFIHNEQSCELIATTHPFHMSMETVPTPSVWNTDCKSIYCCPPSLPPPEPPPITSHHGSMKKLVGLLMMGRSHPY